MANSTEAFGLRFARTIHGGPPSIAPYNAMSSETACIGDIIAMSCSDGKVVIVPNCTTHSGKFTLGVAATYSASGTTGPVWVYDDIANTIFSAKLASSRAATDVGQWFDTTYAAGSTVTGISGGEISNTTNANALDLHAVLLGLVDKPNNAWGLNAEVYVRLEGYTTK